MTQYFSTYRRLSFSCNNQVFDCRLASLHIRPLSGRDQMDMETVRSAQLPKKTVAEEYDLVVLGSGTGSKIAASRTGCSKSRWRKCYARAHFLKHGDSSKPWLR